MFEKSDFIAHDKNKKHKNSYVYIDKRNKLIYVHHFKSSKFEDFDLVKEVFIRRFNRLYEVLMDPNNEIIFRWNPHVNDYQNNLLKKYLNTSKKKEEDSYETVKNELLHILKTKYKANCRIERI